MKKEKDHSVDDEIRAKRKIRAEMRQAWSEQKEKKERKEDRRARKDKRKQADWEKAQAEGEEKLGLVAQFRLGKQKREAEGDEEMDAEYKALKREVKEERTAKKASKEDDEGRQKRMFGDLE